MNINDILENKELKTLVDSSIAKTFYKYRIGYIMECDDFIQEAYLFVIKRIKTFDDEKSTLKTYLPLLVMTCAKNCITFAKGQSKKVSKQDLSNNSISFDYEIADSDTTIIDLISNNEDNIEAKIIINEILTMKNLSQKQKFVISLMAQGYTPTDIANMTGRSVSAINITFQRAKEKIVKKYAY